VGETKKVKCTSSENKEKVMPSVGETKKVKCTSSENKEKVMRNVLTLLCLTVSSCSLIWTGWRGVEWLRQYSFTGSDPW
jgi:hypothetical protein